MGKPGEFNSATASWNGDWRATVSVGDFSFDVDEPVEDGGGGTGPMPTDYFLGSLASCYALALSWAARKRGLELTDLSVRATGRYGTLRFDALTLTVTCNLSDEELAPLLTMASRVCYVSNTMEDPPVIAIETASPVE